MPLAMSIGGVDLLDFELPEELSGVGGTQNIAEKEFPGGTITEQELGAFPLPVTWSGYLTGPTAFARQQTIDAMRAAGQDIEISYGPYAWIGKIKSFSSKVKHQFLVQYQMDFSPSQDLSAASQTGGGAIGIDSLLSTAVGALSSVVGGGSGLALPASMLPDITTLTSTVSSGLLAGNGLISGLSPDALSAIVLAASAVNTDATPIIAGDDATLASPALDASAYASNISAIASSAYAPILQFKALNPNLFMLSQEYYGDPSRWGDIATASGITDPQPIGNYTIQIPPI